MLTNLVIDPQLIIDNIEELIDFMHSTNHNISLFTSENLLPFAQNILKTSNKRNSHEISKMLTTSANADRNQEIIVNQLIQGKSIWIYFGMILEYILLANEHLGLHLSQQYFNRQEAFICSRKINKQMKYKIDQVTYTLFESGLQRFWQRLAYKKINLHIINKIDSDTIITLLNTRGFFILIFSICIILFLVFLMEIVLYKLS